MSAKTIGITGSLASGKSYILDLFAERGAATQNSDIVVHELIACEALEKISKQFPGVAEHNKINRKKLGAIVFANAAELKKLELILHPLVRTKNLEFIKNNQDKKIIALEIPLLFETGAEKICDYTVFVDAPLEHRKKRAFEREGITDEVFEKITRHQMPDTEKRKRADFVINNASGADVKNQLNKILETICAK